MIDLKYFASLRDTVGKADEQVAATAAGTVEDAWNVANPDISMPENTLSALNQVYCSRDSAVKSGDEIAFFPPVTGG